MSRPPDDVLEALRSYHDWLREFLIKQEGADPIGYADDKHGPLNTYLKERHG